MSTEFEKKGKVVGGELTPSEISITMPPERKVELGEQKARVSEGMEVSAESGILVKENNNLILVNYDEKTGEVTIVKSKEPVTITEELKVKAKEAYEKAHGINPVEIEVDER